MPIPQTVEEAIAYLEDCAARDDKIRAHQRAREYRAIASLLRGEKPEPFILSVESRCETCGEDAQYCIPSSIPEKSALLFICPRDPRHRGATAVILKGGIVDYDYDTGMVPKATYMIEPTRMGISAKIELVEPEDK